MRYIGSRNALPHANPLRSVTTFRPAAVLFRSAPQPLMQGTWLADVDPDWTPPAPLPSPTAQQHAERELANAEAALRDALRCHAAARAQIGEANRRILPSTRYMAATALTPEQVRVRKSAAFRLFNQRRAELARDRRRVDAARAVLGRPSLAEQEKREDAAAERVIRRRSPIGQAALAH